MGTGILVNLSPESNPNAPPFAIITKDRTVVGRCGDITMDTSKGKEISKRHTIFYRHFAKSGEKWVVEDRKSLNGTFINGKRIQRSYISHGDEIVFGGGAAFHVGETVLSTAAAECRYVFYLLPHTVKIDHNIDLNKHINVDADPDDCCAICYSPLCAPQILPCGHSFCIGCIREWANSCIKNTRQCVCPMCRKPFMPTALHLEEAHITQNHIHIKTIEPLLFDVNCVSVHQLRKYNVLKKLTMRQKKKYTELFERVKENNSRRALFLHLTHATCSYLLNADDDQLQNFISNFGGNIYDDHNALISTALRMLFERFVVYYKPPIEQPPYTTRPSQRIF